MDYTRKRPDSATDKQLYFGAAVGGFGCGGVDGYGCDSGAIAVPASVAMAADVVEIAVACLGCVYFCEVAYANDVLDLSEKSSPP